MDYLLVVHLNRTHTLEYVKILRRLGVSCSVVETPKRLGLSCGISVKCGKENFVKIKGAIAMSRYTSFHHVYLVSKIGSKIDYRVVY